MTNRSKTAPRLACIVMTTLFACLVVTGCDDNGPTAPRTRVAPTPNLAGSWHGTLDRGRPAAICGENIPVAATFSQDGARITGQVTMTQSGASTTSQFLGDAQGSQLTGTLTAGGDPVAVTGTASSMHILMSYGRDTLFCRTTVIELVR